jgi:endonuclease/exonuclease/phosphatase family metal-dependent hydrolase
VLVTILFPLIVWFSYPRIDTLPPDGKDTVRVMTYNLHNGIDTSGKMSIDEQVEIIKASGADIINLQEVSRGWSINGQFDMLFYLQDKLKTPYVLFMPTADAQWGIAILSYFPITAYQFVELSAPPLVMGRGFIWVDIDLGSKNISLINAHLHHLTDQDATKWRIIEVNEIIEFEDKHPADLVVGDMNASPGSEEMNIFIESGLIDAQKEAGSGEGLTWIYGNYIKPTRLDYIYGNKDVIFSNLVVHESSASDHLSVTVDVQLP